MSSKFFLITMLQPFNMSSMNGIHSWKQSGALSILIWLAAINHTIKAKNGAYSSGTSNEYFKMNTEFVKHKYKSPRKIIKRYTSHCL